jgi:malate dehydrogenase
MARKKIALIGAGMIGGTLATSRRRRKWAISSCSTSPRGIPQGKALDLSQAARSRVSTRDHRH